MGAKSVDRWGKKTEVISNENNERKKRFSYFIFPCIVFFVLQLVLTQNVIVIDKADIMGVNSDDHWEKETEGKANE